MRTILTITQICLLFHFSHANKKTNLIQVSAAENTSNCILSVPLAIQDLKDGVVIDAYDFFDGDEKALNLLGFFNIDIRKQERITVIEYLQRGIILACQFSTGVVIPVGTQPMKTFTLTIDTLILG